MHKKEFNRFEKLYYEVEKELKENKNNIDLNKVIEIYKPFIGDSIFKEDETLDEKINAITRAFILCHQEKDNIDYNIEQDREVAEMAKNISITLLLIRLLLIVLSLNILGIIFNSLSLLSILYGIMKKIKEKFLINDYNDNLICHEYFLHLLESAEIELYRKNNGNDLTNFEQLIELENKIYFKMNNDNVCIETIDNTTNLPINIKLTRHK